MQKLIKIHEKDNVAVAVTLMENIEVSVNGKEIFIKGPVQPGHKVALCDMEEGEHIIKYGHPIGVATQNIAIGELVHTHNIKTRLSDIIPYRYDKKSASTAAAEESFFRGYLRSDGRVGVRNEIWIIPTVGCVNSIARVIAQKANSYSHPGIDNIIAFSHPYGCSQVGDDQENTRKILADLVNHPNAGGVLVLGLGCENSNIHILQEYIGPYDNERIQFLEAQECEDEISDALGLIRRLMQYAGGCKRENISANKLVVGLKCGGSDGLSGITANPLVGAFSDLLVSKGGTTIMTEVPEMFGAETILMNRCASEALFHETVDLINNFKQYFLSSGQAIYENPSPGNKAGGLSTLEDKSLGCTQKSGTASVCGVVDYGEVAVESGLNLLSAPGNDLVASTALAAAGAHIILFTTGRGTPFASPVPTVKISSNSSLSRKKSNWIDFDAGVLINEYDLETLRNTLFTYVLEIASGKSCKSEIAGYQEMAIFKQGVTL